MIICNLYIYNPEEGTILKQYNFNTEGVNIILGEKREDNDETNGVGKSTMIDCLSFLLGKSFTNYYSNNEVLLQKNLFIALKVKVGEDVVFLARSFNNPKYGYSLEGLETLCFEIDKWQKHSLKLFRLYVEEKVLGESIENISFAALREYIIRDEKNGFNDIVLPNRNGLKQYIFLNYLFTMPYLSEYEIRSAKEVIDDLNNHIKLIESMSTNITHLKVSEEQIQKDINELKTTIEQAETGTKYKQSSTDYSLIKKELNNIQNQIFEYEHICRQYQVNIDNLEEKVTEIKQLDDVEGFYQDLIGFFPKDVKENYNKVREFYDFMVESRGEYFKNKIATLDSELKKLYGRKQELENELNESSKILKSEDYIKDLSIVLDELRNKEVELAEVRVRINDYNKKNDIFEKINELQQEILRINSMKYDEFLSYKSKKERLQEIFNQLMEVAYNQNGFLDFEYDNRISYSNNATTGRVKISCSIPDEKSHGRLHMKINMFDLTWFLNRVINNLSINFLVHDGSYSNPDPHVKGVLLKYLDEILKREHKGQYFVTLNKTELLPQDLDALDQAGAVVAKLNRLNNDQNRFFGFKF